VVLSHLSIRINGIAGGIFLWDTAPGDGRAGPSEEDAPGGSVSGFLLGVGLSIGWSSEAFGGRRIRRRARRGG